MYVLKGEIDYFFKKRNSKKINYVKVKKNELIFTPPNEIHTTFFPKNSTLIVSSKNPRDKSTYENDTTRVEFITKSNVKKMIKNARKKN